MIIKPALAMVLLATHLAVPVSSVLAQTAGDVLKAYEALKKPERKMRLIEGAKKVAQYQGISLSIVTV